MKKFLKALQDCKENFELCQIEIRLDERSLDGLDLNDSMNQINDAATDFEMLDNYFKIMF